MATQSSAPDSHAIFADTATVTRQQAEEIAQAQAESQALDKVAADVSSAMSDLIKSNLVVVRRKGTTIEVEIRTDILFPSGSATLSPTAVGVIRKLSQTLVALPNPVRVEGHTDSQPIDTAAFPSNWELSSARAASVVHLIASSGIDPARLSVIGRAQFSPAQPNTTAAGRNANRRVLISILPPRIPRSCHQSRPARPSHCGDSELTLTRSAWHASCTFNQQVCASPETGARQCELHHRKSAMIQSVTPMSSPYRTIC